MLTSLLDSFRCIGRVSVNETISVSGDLAKLVNCNQYADVMFVVDGNKEVYAHKAILLARSYFFY